MRFPSEKNGKNCGSAQMCVEGSQILWHTNGNLKGGLKNSYEGHMEFRTYPSPN